MPKLNLYPIVCLILFCSCKGGGTGFDHLTLKNQDVKTLRSKLEPLGFSYTERKSKGISCWLFQKSEGGTVYNVQMRGAAPDTLFEVSAVVRAAKEGGNEKEIRELFDTVTSFLFVPKDTAAARRWTRRYALYYVKDTVVDGMFLAVDRMPFTRELRVTR